MSKRIRTDGSGGTDVTEFPPGGDAGFVRGAEDRVRACVGALHGMLRGEAIEPAIGFQRFAVS